jgi:hypothetical protein
MATVSNVTPALIESVLEAIGLDNLCWYGQYGRPRQAASYRGDRRRARCIERRLAAAGISPFILKESHYMGF